MVEKCMNCGAELKEGHIFCGQCGTENIKEETVIETSIEEESKVEEIQEPEEIVEPEIKEEPIIEDKKVEEEISEPEPKKEINLKSKPYLKKVGIAVGILVILFVVIILFLPGEDGSIISGVIASPPSAEFSYSISGGSIRLSDKSNDGDGSIVTWYWDYGDGSTSTKKSHTHNYDRSGTYTVTLTVTDNDGKKDTYKKTITVSQPPNKQPTASASANPISGEEPLTVRFTGSGSDSDGYISSYRWNFGDGSTSNQQNPSHTYSNHGSYSVRLTVTDNDDATDASSITIVVTEKPEPINKPPTASASANVETGIASLSVSFTGTSSDPDGDSLSYHWDFKDGKTSNQKSPSHTFQAGTYAVKFTATDPDGLSDSDTVVITVYGDTDGDGIPDIEDMDDDNDGFLDWEDLYPKKNAKIKIMLNKFKVWDVVDAYPNHLRAQVFFDIYLNNILEATAPNVGGMWDVEINETQSINWIYTYDCDDNIQIHKITITMYDRDIYFHDELDIDGHDNSRGIIIYYDIISGYWTGDDIDGITDGSDDGSQHTDDDDAYLEYDITTI